MTPVQAFLTTSAERCWRRQERAIHYEFKMDEAEKAGELEQADFWKTCLEAVGPVTNPYSGPKVYRLKGMGPVHPKSPKPKRKVS